MIDDKILSDISYHVIPWYLFRLFIWQSLLTLFDGRCICKYNDRKYKENRYLHFYSCYLSKIIQVYMKRLNCKMMWYRLWYSFIKGLISVQIIDQWLNDQNILTFLSKIKVTITFWKTVMSGVTFTIVWSRLGENGKFQFTKWKEYILQ